MLGLTFIAISQILRPIVGVDAREVEDAVHKHDHQQDHLDQRCEVYFVIS